jgi:hypothetical protein
LLNAISSGLSPYENYADDPPSAGLERAGIALAYSRLIPPLDRLMLADYDASIRTTETRK